MEKLLRFFKDEDGVTAIEYGLIAAMVAIVIIAGLTILGPALNTAFTTVGNKVNTAVGGG